MARSSERNVHNPGFRLSVIEIVLSAVAAKIKNGWRKLAKTQVHMQSAPKISTPKYVKQTIPVFKSSSCPFLGRKQPNPRIITYDTWLKVRSETNLIRRPNQDTPEKKAAAPQSPLSDIFCAPIFETLASAGCPCACPCGPCSCPCGPCGPCGTCCGNMSDCNCGRLLPPPCNTPPKCIQYMQGYYYYPYGTWFCGPYHVCTGGVPCAGPVCPGTSCGIAPPNPNALCGCRPGCCCGVLGCTGCFPTGTYGTSHTQGYYGQSSPCQQQNAQGYKNNLPGVVNSFPLGTCLVPDMQTGAASRVPNKTEPSLNTLSDAVPANPVTPKWVETHSPCRCADCQANKAATFLNESKKSIENSTATSKQVWRCIKADLVQKDITDANTTPWFKNKELKEPTPIQERRNYCELLKPKH